MRVCWISLWILAVASTAFCETSELEPPGQLVREVVYNELHDHQRHGYWRYWIEQRSHHTARIEEQVETADGPVMRLVSNGGHPLTRDEQKEDQDRLNRLLTSPQEQAQLRQEHGDDERRIGRIVALLPDAFVFEYVGEEHDCQRLRFRPNPDYPAHTIEARILHAMTGELWIDARYKRIARLDGQLMENVDFGYGILGRLYKGGWFRLQRTRVSPTDWKTEGLEIHMSGRALLFKTIAREASESRAGFEPVPQGLSIAQGIQLLPASAAIASVRGRHSPTNIEQR